MTNPFQDFGQIPGICDDFSLAAFCIDQSGGAYIQRSSQVCALIVLPPTATPPSNWATISGWSGVIDNGDLSGQKGRYLAGIGSFLPFAQNDVILSGGRYEEVQDSQYQLKFSVTDMHPGHVSFGRQLERNWTDFFVWLETLGGRLIGGPNGMSPHLVGAKFPFDSGSASTERIDISMNFFF